MEKERKRIYQIIKNSEYLWHFIGVKLIYSYAEPFAYRISFKEYVAPAVAHSFIKNLFPEYLEKYDYCYFRGYTELTLKIA